VLPSTPPFSSTVKCEKVSVRTYAIASIETRLGTALRWVKEQGYEPSGSSCGCTMAVAKVNCQLFQDSMGHHTGGVDLLCREH
jgi:hypothetical protein